MKFELKKCRQLVSEIYARFTHEKMKTCRKLMEKLVECVEAQAGLLPEERFHAEDASVSIISDTQAYMEMFFARTSVRECFGRIEKELTEYFKECKDEYALNYWKDYQKLLDGCLGGPLSDEERYSVLWYLTLDFSSAGGADIETEMERFFTDEGISENPFTAEINAAGKTWTCDLTDEQTYGYVDPYYGYDGCDTDYYGYFRCTALNRGVDLLCSVGENSYWDEREAEIAEVLTLQDDEYFEMYAGNDVAHFVLVKKNEAICRVFDAIYFGTEDREGNYGWIDGDRYAESFRNAEREPLDLGEYLVFAADNEKLLELRMLYAFKAMELKEKMKTLEKGEDAA